LQHVGINSRHFASRYFNSMYKTG